MREDFKQRRSANTNVTAAVLRLAVSCGELGADGAVLQTVVHPTVRGAGCPRVYPSPTGLVVALPRPDGSFQVVESTAGIAHELALPTALTGPPRFIRKTADGGLLWLESSETGALRMFHVSSAGTTQVLAGELGSGVAVPGEAGRLFLTRAFTSGTQRIDELVCTP